ncbi:MAG: FAD binding domain-containing protein, partial [Terriglobia bacterium]
MPLRRFEIHQPASVQEAVRMLRELGEDGCFYGGGTELLLAMKQDVLRYRHLVDVKVIPGMGSIEMTGGVIHLGATATHRAIERSDFVRSHLPVFSEMESRVANVRVRSTGTLGGNLCFGEPHSDPATLLLVLGASIVAEGASGQREVPMAEFMTGAYSSSLAREDIMIGINIPIPSERQRAAYVKFQLHERPTLGLGMLLETPDRGETITGARVAVACVSPFPRRSAAAEELLIGSRAEVERNLSGSADA